MDKELFRIDMIGAMLFAAAAFVVLAMMGSPGLAIVGLVAGAVAFILSALVTSGRVSDAAHNIVVFAVGFLAIVSGSTLLVGILFEVAA